MSNLSISEKDRRLEQIVAYLDGELSPVEASLVERQLAEDTDFRQEMQSIERAWSALDALPTTKVNDRFSQTTMEMVVGAAREEVTALTRALPIQRRKGALGKVLLAAAATVLGLLVVRLMRENPNRMLLADLPVIEYIDVYSQLPDVDFLEKLHNEFGDEVWVADLSEDVLAEELIEFREVADTFQRRDWITALDDEERRTLLGRYNQFATLMPNEQSRLRNLHSSLVSGTDSAELARTMLQYREWLSTLPASRQYELRDIPVDERVREIVGLIRREANNPWIELSPEEALKLERVKRSIRDQFNWRPPERGEPGERRGREGRERGAPNFGQQLIRQLQAHHDEWLPQILAALSEEHQTKFNALDRQQQLRQLVRWIRNDGRPLFAAVTQQELEQLFVEETDPADKERLLALPREQMEQELRRRYVRSVFGEEFGAEWGPMGPPRGGRGGPGPGRGLGRPDERDGFGQPRFEGPPLGDAPRFGPPPPRPGDEF